MGPRRFAVVCTLVLGLAGCATADPARVVAPTGASQTASASAAASSDAPPSSDAAAAVGPVTKVLVFVVENHSFSQMKAEMPYTFSLARRFGYATGYTAVTYPSLPNYVAILGGQTYGISDDGPPSANGVHGPSVFGQALAVGRTAGLYAEDMPGNCATADEGDYAVKHNPWAYFLDERDLCRRYARPVDDLGAAVAAGSLPTVGMVVPNLCNDAHNCPLATADAWFKGWMERILAGPDWRSGRLAVVLTADEDDHSAGNTVLTVVIHPSQHERVVTKPLTHYSLTRLFAEVAGTPYLHGARSAPSMATAFALPLGL